MHHVQAVTRSPQALNSRKHPVSQGFPSVSYSKHRGRARGESGRTRGKSTGASFGKLLWECSVGEKALELRNAVAQSKTHPVFFPFSFPNMYAARAQIPKFLVLLKKANNKQLL